MNEDKKLEVQPVDAPADHGPLVYGRAQLAALVIVEGGNVVSVPPQVFTCVRQVGEGGGIVALVGPETDLGSVRDAVLFAQAFELRNALAKIVECEYAHLIPSALLDPAKAVLDAATPQFLAVDGVKSSEQKLAEATATLDPSLTPSTAGIVDDPEGAVERAEGGVNDASPSSSNPVIH